MPQELTIRRRWCSRDLLVLAAVHAALVAIAGFTLYCRQHLVHAKWIDVVRGAFDHYVDTFTTGMLALALALLVLVVLGSIAAALRIKKLLVVHGMALTLVLIAVVFHVISAFQVSHEASEWQLKTYTGASAVITSTSSDSRDAKEARVAEHFNALYCDAQQAYVCDHATLSTLLQTLRLDALQLNGSVPLLNSSSSVGGSGDAEGGLCANTSSPAWRHVCAYCAQHGAYDTYDAVASWTRGHCAFSPSTTAWCVRSRQANGSATNSADPSPYSSCRPALLRATVHWSRGFSIAWSVTGVLLALLLVAVILLLRTHTYAAALDFDDVVESSAITVDNAVYERA